jgi:hypothetical protein
MVLNKKKTGMNYGLMALMGLVSILAFGTMAASAWSMSDIPIAVNNSLFGGMNIMAAELILTAIVIISVAITCQVGKQELAPTVIIMVATLGALTAIGWAPIWLMLMAGLIIAGFFGVKMADVYSSAKKG